MANHQQGRGHGGEHDDRGAGRTSARDGGGPVTDDAASDHAAQDDAASDHAVRDDAARDETPADAGDGPRFEATEERVEELADELVDELLDEVTNGEVDLGTHDDPLVVQRTDTRVPVWLDTSVQYTWRGLVLIAGISALIYVMTRLYLVSLPIIIALILSTLCVPIARRLQRRGMPALLAAAIVVIGGIGSLGGVIALLTPAFVTQIQELQPTVLDAVDQVLTWLEEGPIGYDRSQIEALFSDAMASLEGAAGTIAASVGSIAVAVVEGVTALILAVVLLFFFVKDGEQIVDWFQSRVPIQHRDDVRAAGARGWVALSGFVRGTAAVALIDAIGIGVGLAIVGVPLVLPLAVLVFFGGFVPVIGAFVTGLLAVLVALADGGLVTALIVAGIVLLVQQIESNVLQPTIMRRAVALHPTVILGVLTAGAVLIGVVGAFLAVPVAAVMAAVGNELRLRHEARGHGVDLGPEPIGGPGVDPNSAMPDFPADTSLRAAGRKRRGPPPANPEARRRLRRRARKAAREALRQERADASDEVGTQPPRYDPGEESGDGEPLPEDEVGPRSGDTGGR
jgi:predicted PurR-regulated permease PerM